MILKIALVDDEQIYLDEMAELCRGFGAENRIDMQIAQFSDGESFLNSPEEYPIVFMDIYMNGTDGVLTAKKLRRRSSSGLLIFMTSSSEHMPEAFSCHAFEYIVKPFSAPRVSKVLGDALKVIPRDGEYVELCIGKKCIRTALGDIVSVVTDAHYLEIDLTDGDRLRCRMTAGRFSEITGNDRRFILINKGIMVNADHITEFENSCCILENGRRLPIRIRDRLKIEQAVRNYNFEKIRKRQCGG